MTKKQYPKIPIAFSNSNEFQASRLSKYHALTTLLPRKSQYSKRARVSQFIPSSTMLKKSHLLVNNDIEQEKHVDA